MTAVVTSKTRDYKSKEAWQSCRELWEAKPTMTYANVADILGCTKQAVNERARREGWTRPTDVVGLSRRATTIADQKEVRRIKRVREVAAEAEAKGVVPPEPPVAIENSPIEAGTAVAMRANVLTRHRKEWDGARNLVYQAINKADDAAARRGKIIADTLAIIQAGERKAWQLDVPETSGEVPGELKIVIERV